MISRDKLFSSLGFRRGYILAIFIFFIVIFAYFIPVFIFQKAFGTDVYTHMTYTKDMFQTESLFEFYESHPKLEYGEYNYPFGLWMLGSIIAKISGIGPYQLSYILPSIFLIIIILVYFQYAKRFLYSNSQMLLSIIFLLSMPVVSTHLLSYRPTVLIIPFLLTAFYLALKEEVIIKDIPLILLLVFCIGMTHTGSFLFLTLFTLVYLIIDILIRGKFPKNMFILGISTFFIYAIIGSLFPHVYYQYITKATLILTVGNYISSALHLPFVSELSKILYDEVFYKGSFTYAIIFSAIVYGVCGLILFLRPKILGLRKRKNNPEALPLMIPFIGDITHISHSVMSTPFWIGPIQTVLSAFGIIKINNIGRVIFLSAILVCLFPAMLHTGLTGALREIYYLLIIIPIISAIGFDYALSLINKYLRGNLHKMVITIFLLSVFVPALMMPIVGNIYYVPDISGAEFEVRGMQWLSNTGMPNEKCLGFGYRDMVRVYTDKEVPDIEYGTEMRTAIKELEDLHFLEDSEKSINYLSSVFGVKYIISSERVINNLQAISGRSYRTPLKIDSNRLLDKLYSGTENFSIYKYNRVSTLVAGQLEKKTISGITFDETSPTMQDIGARYIVETDYYKLIIDKDRPKIHYLGDNKFNFLGEGYFIDYIWLYWNSGPYKDQYITKNFEDFSYTTEIDGNKIIYKTTLTGNNKTEKWTSIIFEYTFYQKAIKREIIVANDWVESKNAIMDVELYTEHFSPLTQFAYQEENEKITRKEIYPSEDKIKLKDLKFNSIYFYNENNGIYLEYTKDSQYPSSITYQGSTSYDYGYVSVNTGTVSNYPSTSTHVTQYLSIGDEEIARENVNFYRSVSIYDYPNGTIPIILTSLIENLRTMSTTDFNKVINAHSAIQEKGVSSYTEAITMQEEEIAMNRMINLSKYSINIIGYEKIDSSEQIIEKAKNNAKSNYSIDLDGFMLYGMEYTPNTINALTNQSILFIVATSIRSPIAMYFQEGFRHPQMTYYHGNETQLVLLPISEPTSEYLRPGLNVEDSIMSWKTVIDSVVGNEELCVFLWCSAGIGSPEYLNYVMEVVDYARDKGMTFSKPEDVAEHFTLTKRISVIVKKETDKTTIFVTNNNNKSINGLTLKVIMPKIESKCPYQLKGTASTPIQKTSQRYCIYYITIDLSSNESKTILIEPNISRKTFRVYTRGNVIEGNITIEITDNEDRIVPEAIVTINKEIHIPDEEGKITTYLRRGNYQITIEKPGFETFSYTLGVKSKIYILAGISIWLYVVVILSLTLILIIKIRKK